jgi:hypothetical protein
MNGAILYECNSHTVKRIDAASAGCIAGICHNEAEYNVHQHKHNGDSGNHQQTFLAL